MRLILIMVYFVRFYLIQLIIIHLSIPTILAHRLQIIINFKGALIISQLTTILWLIIQKRDVGNRTIIYLFNRSFKKLGHNKGFRINIYHRLLIH